MNFKIEPDIYATTLPNDGKINASHNGPNDGNMQVDKGHKRASANTFKPGNGTRGMLSNIDWQDSVACARYLSTGKRWKREQLFTNQSFKRGVCRRGRCAPNTLVITESVV